ncbi:MAG: putative baseplate assembly protein [Rhizobacter sp.]
MKYFCCDTRRLAVVRESSTLNAIDWLEVRDHLEPVPTLRQKTLFVRLLRSGFMLDAAQVVIEGGERIPSVDIAWVLAGDDPTLPSELLEGLDHPAATLVVRTTSSGDFSRYTLRLRAAPGSELVPPGFDPRLSQIAFSFKVECPSDFDCAVATTCPPVPTATPQIDYLAKDYTGFRRLMLDRLNLLSPGWSERSAADVGVALVELMAYAADNLSYRQDAIANEAYLATAHNRISVRRHARLVDYRLHDGCNARAWVHVQVAADALLPARTPLLTRSAALPATLLPGSREVRDALAAGVQVFETAADAQLRVAHNQFALYTWGDRGCCLPRGATRATLRGAHPQLQANDVLVFQEVLSPTTFTEQDADPTRRWAVRLTRVNAATDPCGQLFDTPPVDGPLALTEIEWSVADALPFPVCITVCDRPEVFSTVLGNMVLADHGRSVVDEALPAVPQPLLRRVREAALAGACSHEAGELIPVRYRPVLAQLPLTQGFRLADELAVLPDDNSDNEDTWWSASGILQRDPHDALPSQCELRDAQWPLTPAWRPQHDLLASSATDPHFVAEAENDGLVRLRFGDDLRHGQRPRAGTQFSARYRVGNGAQGNVGAATIAHVVSNQGGVFERITNPMPAAGGTEPEDVEAARRDAPEAFRRQERAVTAADYAAAAERRADVQRAATSFRWTGSWHTVFVSADRVGGAGVDAGFEARLRRHLERFRMAGYDLEVEGPRYVALDIALHICVKPEYFRAEVLRVVQAELGSGVLPDGRLGVFHPDNFTFAQPVYLSRIVAAAQAVEGVQAVWAQKFERMADPDPAALGDGVIPIGRLEIAQLANNPSFRERGRLLLEAGGGK